MQPPDFRSLFESLPGVYLVMAADAPRYTIVAVSDGYARQTMTRREAIVGKGIFEAFPDNPVDREATTSRQDAAASFARVIATRAPDVVGARRHDIRRPIEQGGGFEERWWRLVNSPLFGPGGELTHILNHVEDVTDLVRHGHESREMLHASERRLRELFESTPDGIFIADPDGHFSDVNPAACRLLDRSRDELLALSMVDIVPPEDLARQAAAKQHLQQGGVEMSEWRLRRKDGTYVPVELSLKALPDGRLQGLARDIAERRAAQEALRVSEAKYAGIISISADAIISIDATQRIVIFNHGAEKIFGYTKAEAIGAPLDILIPERFRAAHHQHVDGFATGAASARQMGERLANIAGRRKNGEEFPAEAAISKIELEGQSLLTVALRDITARKRIEAEDRLLSEVGRILISAGADHEDLLAEVANVITRGLADWCSVDLVQAGHLRRLRVVHSDPAKAAVCEALERHPHPHRSVATQVAASQHSVLVSEVMPGYFESVAEDAEHLQLLHRFAATSFITTPLVARGHTLGTLSIGTSGASRRCDPEDLRVAELLAVRVALAVDNAGLYQNLAHAVRARDEVLGIVAHDLRNPLSAIDLAAQVLQRQLAGQHIERGKASIEGVRRSCRRANRLIEDLLDVTRIEAGQLAVTRQRLSAEQLILDGVEGQQLLAVSSSLELGLDVERSLPEIAADRDRCLQVLENLLGNAIKFTPPGGRITVGAAHGAGEVEFWVADNGPGIAAADLPHVFDQFWQARRAERRGAGLGLQICKGIVEAHGGRIWVESTLGRGTTFHFAIPTWRSDDEHPPVAAR